MEQFVYVVFSATPYRIGKWIRRLTDNNYNHVSISLDPELSQMYSFSRRHYKTPLWGGFCHESPARLRVRGETAKILLCRIPVTQEQYTALKDRLTQMHKDQYRYLYNHLSILSAPFHKAVPVRDAATCLEFCISCLSPLGISVAPGEYCTLQNLESKLRPWTIYEGPLPPGAETDEVFFTHIPLSFFKTCRDMLRLLPRIGK